jgi:hypothetical protein
MTAPGEPTDIQGVLAALRVVVDEAAADGDRVGYFAALYRQVTLAVAAAIDEGVFDDGPRLSRFDAAFGGRYLRALRAHRAGADGVPKCWRLAFEACTGSGPVIVQHLVLGVNAHVNLDLAVAAAQTCPGDAIDDLKGDFDRINTILAAVMGRLDPTLAEFSPLMGGLDAVLGRLDEEILGFKLNKARAEAWEAAVLLAHQPAPARPATERMLDRYAAGLARLVLAPPWPVPAALDVVRFTERAPVADVVRGLDRIPGVTGG